MTVGGCLDGGYNITVDHGGWDVDDRCTASRLALDSDVDHADPATAAHGAGMGVVREE